MSALTSSERETRPKREKRENQKRPTQKRSSDKDKDSERDSAGERASESESEPGPSNSTGRADVSFSSSSHSSQADDTYSPSPQYSMGNGENNGAIFDMAAAGPSSSTYGNGQPIYSPSQGSHTWSPQGLTRDWPGTSSSEDGEGEGGGAGQPSKKVQSAGRNLYGNLHVAGIRVPDMDEVPALWFLFTVS